MNKSELIQELENKYHKVFVSSKALDGDVIKRYEAIVYDEVAGSLQRRRILFYVEDEGQAGEVAYWDGTEPKTTPVVTFDQEVDAYVQSKIADGTIEGGFIDYVDASKEIAYGRAIIDQTGLIEKMVFIDKDAGNLRYRIVG